MSVESVLLKTPLVANTGYGNDGFALTRALDQRGFDVRLSPTTVVPPLPMGVAKTLTKPLDADFDYIIHHIDPQGIGLTDGEKSLPGKRIAWSMWEFTRMAPEIAETLAERLDGYTDLFVYDEVSYEAFAPYAEQAGVRVRVLQGGFWADDWDFDISQRDWSGPFRFCMVGQLHQRKNPFAAIKAFNRLREEFDDVELHLKTTVLGLHPTMEQAYPGLKIHYTLWPHEELKKFYGQCHTYVAPSWGEGKNLPALEAQTMGIPVIYSDFGGHRQWGSSEMGWPVSGSMAEHVEGLPSFRVDDEALYQAMRDAYVNRSNTRNKGMIASQYIPAQSDWSNVVRRLIEMVNRD